MRKMPVQSSKTLYLFGTALLTFLLLIGFPKDSHARYAHIVFDANSGKVLEEKSQHEPRQPASLTKMMTIYMAFEAVKSGRMQWNDKLRVSKRAARQPPSKLGLNPGDSITLRNAVMALVTRSANDMAAAIGESLAGSEAKFAQNMTAKARRLGMTRTTFRNASGLPARGQITTARDMGVLGQALIRDFPDFYKMFNTTSFVYRGEEIQNHNHLLRNYPGLDGIKTGYIRASGFNLVASAMRGDRRLIGVVMGGRSAPWRDRQMAELLDNGFEKIGIGKTYAAYAVSNRTTPTATSNNEQEDIPDQVANQDFTATNETEPASTEPASVASNNAEVATQSANSVNNESTETQWGLQVGAYRTLKQAKSAANRAKRHSDALKTAEIKITQVAQGHKRLYRARLMGMDESDAAAACAKLKKRKIDCKVIAPGSTTS